MIVRKPLEIISFQFDAAGLSANGNASFSAEGALDRIQLERVTLDVPTFPLLSVRGKQVAILLL